MDFSYEICGLVCLERVNKDYVLNEVCVWGVLWHFFGECDTIIWTIWQLSQDNFETFSRTVLTYSQKYIHWVNLLNAQTQFLILKGTLKQGFKASLGKIQKNSFLEEHWIDWSSCSYILRDQGHDDSHSIEEKRIARKLTALASELRT